MTMTLRFADYLTDKNEAQLQTEMMAGSFQLPESMIFEEILPGNKDTEVIARADKAQSSEGDLANTGVGNQRGVKGVVLPKHMLYGTKDKDAHVNAKGNAKKASKGVKGMLDHYKDQVKKYGQFGNPVTHAEDSRRTKKFYEEHSKKPEEEQDKLEKEASGRVGRKIMQGSPKAETVDGILNKNDVPYHGVSGPKQVSGHAVMLSGHPDHPTIHVKNMCHGQDTGCGSKPDKDGNIDVSKGLCFGTCQPKQYPAAAVSRGLNADFHSTNEGKHQHHEDLKLAYLHELKKSHKAVTKKGAALSLRADTSSEGDTVSEHAVRTFNKGLEKKRAASSDGGKTHNGKHIGENIDLVRYSATGKMNDPKNNIHTTHSDKGGAVVKDVKGDGTWKKNPEGKRKEKFNIQMHSTGTNSSGEAHKNNEGEITPTHHAYLVVGNVDRHTEKEDKMREAIHTHRNHTSPINLSDEHNTSKPQEDRHDAAQARVETEGMKEGEWKHFDGEGKETSEDKGHYGYSKVGGKIRRYQNHNVIPMRVDHDEKTGKVTPTDDRQNDTRELEKKLKTEGKERYKSHLVGRKKIGVTPERQGEHLNVGGTLMATPVPGSFNAGNIHNGQKMMYHVHDSDIKNAKEHHGIWDTNHPKHQEEAEKNVPLPEEDGEFKGIGVKKG
jgi:hypothetical protein